MPIVKLAEHVPHLGLEPHWPAGPPTTGSDNQSGLAIGRAPLEISSGKVVEGERGDSRGGGLRSTPAIGDGVGVVHPAQVRGLASAACSSSSRLTADAADAAAVLHEGGTALVVDGRPWSVSDTAM